MSEEMAEGEYWCWCCDEQRVPSDGPSYCEECLHDPGSARRCKRRRLKRACEEAGRG